jgi:hypothetical protein
VIEHAVQLLEGPMISVTASGRVINLDKHQGISGFETTLAHPIIHEEFFCGCWRDALVCVGSAVDPELELGLSISSFHRTSLFTLLFLRSLLCQLYLERSASSAGSRCPVAAYAIRKDEAHKSHWSLSLGYSSHSRMGIAPCNCHAHLESRSCSVSRLLVD